MSARTEAFREIAGLGGVLSARCGKLRCTAIPLSDDGICLYSPVAGLEDEAAAILERCAGEAFLLAPNHYHNRALAAHVRRFPSARLICPPESGPRLKKQTGLAFDGLDTLSGLLPPNVRLLKPAGLKTGEVWIQVTGPAGVAWIVCDALTSAPSEGSDCSEAPAMLGTFPKFGVRDGAAYKAWVSAQTDHEKPTILVPCHGDPVFHPDLGSLLVDLVETHL